jgi:general secretion pathway protein B
MSLILEALRKSEAERRLGSAPDLLTTMPVLRMSAPRRQWPVATAGAVLLLAVLASIWWWTRIAPPPRVAVVAPSSQVAVGHDANAIATNVVHRDVPQTPVTARMTRTPMIAPPMADASRVATPAHVVAVPSAPPTATPHAAIEPVQSSTATPVPAPVMPAAPTFAAEPALLSLADLSADERNGLPALKVSMHVYADDPTHRFMIIDGQRVGEGARLADGVVLVRIRRDGAELDVRGRRLLLPKP